MYSARTNCKDCLVRHKEKPVHVSIIRIFEVIRRRNGQAKPAKNKLRDRRLRIKVDVGQFTAFEPLDCNLYGLSRRIGISNLAIPVKEDPVSLKYPEVPFPAKVMVFFNPMTKVDS